MIEIASRKNVVSLTGIRGIAALYVVIHHFIGTGGFPNVWQTFLTHGYFAVDLFFVLSGFVMALTYHSMFLTEFSTATYLKFMQRRVARIYPIYFITTAAALVLILLGEKAGNLRGSIL